MIEHLDEATKELLAEIADVKILKLLLDAGAISLPVRLPKIVYRPDSEGFHVAFFEIDGEDRRLIVDCDYRYLWYNPNGTEE